MKEKLAENLTNKINLLSKTKRKFYGKKLLFVWLYLFAKNQKLYEILNDRKLILKKPSYVYFCK